MKEIIWIFNTSHPLTNFEIQKYYHNEPKFNGVYSIDNLPNKNKGWGICNKFRWAFGYWYSLGCFYVKDNITYCDSFGVEHIPKKIIKFIGNKNVITNICRI